MAFFFFVMSKRKNNLLLVATLLLACNTSCIKRCTCTEYENGYATVIHEDVRLGDSEASKCSDLSQLSDTDPLDGLKCE